MLALYCTLFSNFRDTQITNLVLKFLQCIEFDVATGSVELFLWIHMLICLLFYIPIRPLVCLIIHLWIPLLFWVVVQMLVKSKDVILPTDFGPNHDNNNNFVLSHSMWQLVLCVTILYRAFIWIVWIYRNHIVIHLTLWQRYERHCYSVYLCITVLHHSYCTNSLGVNILIPFNITTLFNNNTLMLWHPPNCLSFR